MKQGGLTMAKCGTYRVELNKAHLEWGTHRYTNSRGRVYGEGYIPIPLDQARKLNIFNGNGTGGADILGENLFNCVSDDGKFSGVLRAQGDVRKGDPYAKQFAGNNNLKAIGKWYADIDAEVGDVIEVSVISETDIVIRKLR